MKVLVILEILVLLAVCVVNIMFFIKMWKMCNNVARLTEKLAPKTEEEIKAEEASKDDSNAIAYVFVVFIVFVVIMVLCWVR